MELFVTRKGLVGMFLTLALAIGLLGGTFVASAHSASPQARAIPTAGTNPFCQRIGTSVGASSGAWTYCKGPQPSGSGHPTGTGSTFGSNVNAANVKEDVTSSGARAYGQSETSIASVGPYVIEAWNDSTGFFAPCPSPKFKEELTGVGFSANGGTSFKDEGGLPNNCSTGFKYFGDPTVETWKPGGTAYFYVESLYLSGTGQSDLALDACKATGTGSTANLSCSKPIIVATGASGDFLDKEFLSIDPQRGRLYTSYTRFGAFGTPTANGQIELAVCDIGTASGKKGTGGGTAGAPACFPGASPAPYFVVQPAQVCENEGAYPAVDVKSGNVYVAWEYNWATNFMGPAPCNTTEHTQNRIAYVPSTCLTLTPVSPCTTTPLIKAVNIVSIDLAFIPGYNRNPNGSPANDFPRIAVSHRADPSATVTIVWNDTRYHALGDILLQSFHLVTLANVQNTPARINPDATGGLHFLPALRNSDDEGFLNVSYYQRKDGDVANTNVDAVLNLDPLTTGSGSVTLVTTSPSNWNNASSDIVPNFGDYTDNYIHATSNAPYTDDVLYVAWSDGRLGVPQPFEAHGFS